MQEPCPDPETLAAWREGVRTEALERHLPGCPACLDALALLGPGSSGAAPVRRRLPFWTAAAALLLAVGLAALRPGHGPEEAPVLPSPAGLPQGGGLDLLLEPGAVADASLRDGAVRFLSGRAWLGASGSRPVRVLLPGQEGILRKGRLAVELGSPRREASFLRSAEAAEACGTLWVLEGEFELAGVRHPEGTRLALGAGSVSTGTIAEEDRLRLLRAEASAAVALPGRDLFEAGVRVSGFCEAEGGAPGTYRWTTVLCRRDAPAEVALVFPAGGAWYEWVTGLGAGAPRDGEVLEVLWDGERAIGRVGGRTAFAADPAGLSRLLRPASGRRWGITVWGGSSEIRRSILAEGGGK